MNKKAFTHGGMLDSKSPIDNRFTIQDYWVHQASEIVQAMGSGPQGLDADEAASRLVRYGRNTLREHRQHTITRLFLDRFRSPLLLILIFASLIAVVLRDWLDALIVIGIVFISAILSTLQEYRASNAIEKLRRRISAKTTVLRDAKTSVIRSEEVVPGDIVLFSAGSLVPADGLLLEAKDFYVSQALLTGETFPVEKRPGLLRENVTLAERSNCVFMGTSVRSGTAKAIIVQTARDTELGRIADTITLRPPETEFDRGIRHFGGLLMRVMILIVLAVLSVNILLKRPTVDTLLFAMALAVGLSPELLPAILAITLSRGAQRMAKQGVIVRHLNAIENLGSMDVLCTDKTGTLTEGVVKLDAAANIDGQNSDHVLRLAYLNSYLQTGLSNPLDEAVVTAAEAAGVSVDKFRKLDEVPYDFVRKRLSIVVSREHDAAPLMITKGALQNVLDVCDHQQRGESIEALDEAALAQINKHFSDWSEQGFRLLGVAYQTMSQKAAFGREDEQAMVFAGFLLFFDPPEPGVRQTLNALYRLGVQLTIITGDNQLVARHVAEAVGIKVKRIVTGAELAAMKDEALLHLAPKIPLFAEVDPNQKERIILALQKTGHVVGYLGDGINDAPALHTADVGISVDKAVDVAKEAADFVLLEHDLSVLREGIDEGRRTFANTLKYIYITTSANFGNMISMALASFFLPFLPLLAKQILLNNFLSDIPTMGIAGDNVDPEWERTPHRWDIRFVRNSMITFGLVSTVFDMITFGVLLYLVGETPEMFRTGWFVESLLTELFILFILRTYKPFYQSRPGRLLMWTTLAVALLTIVLPYIPIIGPTFDLVPLRMPVLIMILLISVFYIVVSELTKRSFYHRLS
jgi:Mg2+-importing ATPase